MTTNTGGARLDPRAANKNSANPAPSIAASHVPSNLEWWTPARTFGYLAGLIESEAERRGQTTVLVDELDRLFALWQLEQLDLEPVALPETTIEAYRHQVRGTRSRGRR